MSEVSRIVRRSRYAAFAFSVLSTMTILRDPQAVRESSIRVSVNPAWLKQSAGLRLLAACCYGELVGPAPGPMRRILLLLVAALAPLAVAPATADAAVNFQVKGKWTCNNRGTVIPIAGARLELWREISWWPDDKVGTAGHTASDGSFNFGVNAGSNFDLYVKLVLHDDRGVRLENWYSPWVWSTETSTTRSHAGVVDLGTWQISKNDGKGTPKCAIWQGAHNAYANYRQVVGSNPPSADYLIDADFPCCGTPFTTRDTTRWPPGYQTGSGSSAPGGPFSVSFHEFAHSVRHTLDGNFAHFLLDVARYGYARNHSACLVTNEGFAFNEGWAEYWARTPHTCGDGTNLSQEGNVAAALTSLEKCLDRRRMVQVLRQSAGGIHSFNEFRTRFFQIFGLRTCIFQPVSGVEAVEAALTPPQLTRNVQSEIDAQKKLVSNLSGQVRRSRGRARNPGRCPSARGCLPAVANLIEPYALNAQLRQAKLVLDRLQDGLAEARRVDFQFTADFQQRKFFDKFETDRRAFERANQAILINGLKQSIDAIKSKPRFRRARSTDLFRTLDRRLDSLTRMRTRGQGTPAGLESLYSEPESPLETAQRVRPR
jgi:hypothetical protein